MWQVPTILCSWQFHQSPVKKKEDATRTSLELNQGNEISPLSSAWLAALPVSAVTLNLFTVVNNPFTAGNWCGACDRTFTRQIYHGNIHVYIKETHIKIYHGFINMGNAFYHGVCTTPNNIVAFFAHYSWSIAPTKQPAAQR